MIAKDTCTYFNTTIFSETIYTEGTGKVFLETTKWVTIASSAIVALFLIVLLIMLSANANTEFSIIIVFIFLISWVVLLIWLFYRYKLKFKRDYRKLIKTGKASEQKSVFGEEFVSVITETSNSNVYYKQISHIYETKHACIMILDGSFSMFDYLLLDKAGFTQGSYEEFCAFFIKKTDARWK